MQLTEIRARNNTVCASVQRITCGNSLVDNLLQLAGRRVVVKSLLHDVGVEMVSLLLSVTNSRGTDDQAIIFLACTLTLRPTLTTTFGAALVVQGHLAAVGNIVEVLGELLSDDSHLFDGLISEHVHRRPVDSTIVEQKTWSKLVSMLPNPPSVKPETAPYITPPGADIEPD
jgi:hypothetical protein